jgi:hypothetical protein
MTDKPLTQKDLVWFRLMKEWLGLSNTHTVYSMITGKPIGYIKLN